MTGVSQRQMRENLLGYFSWLEKSSVHDDLVNFGCLPSKGAEPRRFTRGMQALDRGLGDTVTKSIDTQRDIKESAQDGLSAHLYSRERADGFKSPQRSPIFMGFVNHGPFLFAIHAVIRRRLVTAASELARPEPGKQGRHKMGAHPDEVSARYYFELMMNLTSEITDDRNDYNSYPSYSGCASSSS